MQTSFCQKKTVETVIIKQSDTIDPSEKKNEEKSDLEIKNTKIEIEKKKEDEDKKIISTTVTTTTTKTNIKPELSDISQAYISGLSDISKAYISSTIISPSSNYTRPELSNISRAYMLSQSHDNDDVGI